MERETFHIPKISCGHCTMAIENELKELDGVQNISSDIEGKNVTVEFQAPVTTDKIRDALKEISYPAE